uniref:Apolipoprotein M n=1 Tax=Amphilophus citrinellus TaxID=61819 RepID=A0A3Q0R7H6_AMPCI
MLAVCATAVVCLMSLSHAAPLACEHLLRPLNQLDPHHLEGRWAMVAGILSEPSFIEDLKLRDSATATFSSTNETNISFRRSMSLNNTCFYGSYNISLEGSTFIFDNGRVNTTFVHTCHDCILMSFDVESGTRRHFYLYSRRRHSGEVPESASACHDGLYQGGVALQQEGPGFDSTLAETFLCVVFTFSLLLCGFSPGTLVSSYSPKTCT